jgi:membrane-bound serine protease (ClpP class)
MNPGFWAVALLFLGLLLLIAEVFIPSGGIIGSCMAGALVLGIILAWMAWWRSSPLYFWLYLGSLAMILPGIAIVAFHVWPHTPLGRRAMLQPPSEEEVDAFADEEEELQTLVGRTAKTVTPLNPAGMIVIDDRRLHCQSEGNIIDPGCWVRILSATHNRVVVRRMSESEVRALEEKLSRETAPAPDSGIFPAPSKPSGDGLDFELQ